jgi:hypothetical protein
MRFQFQGQQEVITMQMTLSNGPFNQGRKMPHRADFLDAGNLGPVAPLTDQQVLERARNPDRSSRVGL